MIDINLTKEAAYRAMGKEEIINALKKFTKKGTLMFAHFGGSIAYGTYEIGVSDIDVIAFYDGIDRICHVGMDGVDIFAYPRRCVDLGELYGDWVGSYNKSFMDVKLALPDTLIYLDEDYRGDYEKYAKEPFEKVLKTYLDQFIDFFSFRLERENRPSKKLYHLIRVVGQIEEYGRTGKWGLSISDERRKEVLDYKKHWQNPEKFKETIDKANDYLERIKAFREELGNDDD